MKYQRNAPLISKIIAFTLMALVPLTVVPAGGLDQPKQADVHRKLRFPGDHGKHPGYETEWHYFTGHLKTEDKRHWGFQVTFFRRTMFHSPGDAGSAWTARDVYPAHFALSDITNQTFFHDEMITREGPGLAESSAERLYIRIKDWLAVMEDGNIHLKASSEVHALDLTLTPLKPPVLHGEQGFSTKGNNPGQASHYYSFTRLRARGSLKTKGEILPVSGLAWMDHEFGSSIMLPDQSGWDWFSVQLEDDTELMVFNMRKRDNTKERHFGTYVFPDGAKRDLKDMDVEIRALDTWKSEKTKAVYPSGWEITVRELDLELTVQPLLKDQELISEGSTGVVYWEGAVEVTGVKNKEKIQGQGYVELTGYAHSMAGRL